MKLVSIVIFVVFAFILMAVGCGAKVEVPPAHVGKVLTKNGYAPETISPSKFRLSACLFYCDKLVLLEASDKGFKEVMVVFMPKDKLNLTLEVRGTQSIPTDPKTVASLYDRIVSTPTEDSDISVIAMASVYETYGQQALRGVIRSEVVKYTIGDILEQREAIGQSIHAQLSEKMSTTNIPLRITRFELADVQPPAVIVAAQQAAKEREIDIQKAEADAEVDLVKAEKNLMIAKKDRLVEKEKALAIAEQNDIAARSITPQLLAYRKLEVAEKIYTELSKSNNVIIVPADSSGFSNINDEVILSKMLEKAFKTAAQ